jgi:peptidoglycan/xylan/chitin deacetylase (PgdA/CDA1 family)
VQARFARRWRWHVKAALASAVGGMRRRGIGSSLGRPDNCPLVLGYHRIVESFEATARTDMPGMLTSSAMLERHLDCLGRRFTFVGLDDIADHLRRGVPFEKPVAAVTFDDGYRDVYDHAYPLLRRKGIPGAVFVVTDLVGRPFWQIHDRLYRLMAKAFATWNDPRRQLRGLLTTLHPPAADLLAPRIATSHPLVAVSTLLPGLSHVDVLRVLEGLEAAVGNGFGPAPLTLTWPMVMQMRQGGFVIGSHTQAHVSLPAESVGSLDDELSGSKRELERRLGEPIEHFAYPDGQFTPRVVEAVHRVGYRCGYTACRHQDVVHPDLTIERLLLWERSSVDAGGRFSSDILTCQADGLWPRRCARLHSA